MWEPSGPVGRREARGSPPTPGRRVDEGGPGLSLGALRLWGSRGGRASKGDRKGQPALGGMAGEPRRARAQAMS